MFREYKQVKQERGSGHRRWFEADGLDLVVWYDAVGSVTGFQLCYDFGGGEHALTWRHGRGYSHDRVDAGDDSPLKNESPVLLPDGAVPWANLLRKFDAHSTPLEPPVRQLIRDALAPHAKA